MSRLRPDIGDELQRLFGWYLRLRYDTEGGDDALTRKFVAAVKRFRPRARPAVAAP